MALHKSLAPLRTYLQGKTHSYYLNAIDNAKVASLLLKYIKTNQSPPKNNPLSQRTNQITSQAYPAKRGERHAHMSPAQRRHDQQKLAVIAYTLHHINGHMDYIFAS